MIWIFLLFLLVLAGVIAYAGDVIGRRIGRKHYRLFGLRPKTTALIYAIGSGVLISLVSVLFFAALNQQALRNILEADSLRGEVVQLKYQVNPLRAEIKQNQILLEGARIRLEAAQRQVAKLGARQKEILLDKSALEIEVSTLESVKNDLAIRTVQLEENSVQLEDRASTLQTQVLEAETRVVRTNRQLEARGKALVEVQTRFQAGRVQLERTQAQFQAGREKLRLSQQQLEERQAQLKVSQTQLKSSQVQLKVSRQNLALSQGQLDALQVQKADLERRSSQSVARLAQLERAGADLERSRVQLEAEKTRLNAALVGEKSQAAQVRTTLTTLETRSSALQSELTRQSDEVSRLKKTRDTAQADLRKLGQQRAQLERDNGTLKAGIAQLKNERVQLQADLDKAGGELEAQRTGEFVYRKNDLVFQTTLERIDGPTLDAALQKALRRVSSRGAKGSLSSVLSPDQKTALLARMQALGGRSLLVLRSATNTIAGTPVTFQAEAVNNALIFPRAQPIRSRLIAVGGEEQRSNDELRASINTLEDAVLETLRGAGVPPENVLEGGLSEADTFELLSRLKTLGGSVLVGIAARNDVRPSSSVELYPIILR